MLYGQVLLRRCLWCHRQVHPHPLQGLRRGVGLDIFQPHFTKIADWRASLGEHPFLFLFCHCCSCLPWSHYAGWTEHKQELTLTECNWQAWLLPLVERLVTEWSLFLLPPHHSLQQRIRAAELRALRRPAMSGCSTSCFVQSCPLAEDFRMRKPAISENHSSWEMLHNHSMNIESWWRSGIV